MCWWKVNTVESVMIHVCCIDDLAVWKCPASRTHSTHKLTLLVRHPSVWYSYSGCTGAWIRLYYRTVSLLLVLDSLTSQHWFMTPANTHSQQTSLHSESLHEFVCFALMWLIILSVLSAAFLKCNLKEQHERCETPENTPLHPTPCSALLSPRLVCAGSPWCLLCIGLACIFCGIKGNWIPLVPVKCSLGLNRKFVIYCNFAINTPSMQQWLMHPVFGVLSYNHSFQFVYSGVLFSWCVFHLCFHFYDGQPRR